MKEDSIPISKTENPPSLSLLPHPQADPSHDHRQPPSKITIKIRKREVVRTVAGAIPRKSNIKTEISMVKQIK